MKKTKRIMAFIGAIILILMYGSTLFFAFFDQSATMGFFKASIACTILFPVLIYGYTLVYKLTNHKDEKDSTPTSSTGHQDKE